MPKQPIDTGVKPQQKKQKSSSGNVKLEGSKALLGLIEGSKACLGLIREEVKGKAKSPEPKGRKRFLSSLMTERVRTKPVLCDGVVLMIPCDLGQEDDEQMSTIEPSAYVGKKRDSFRYQVQIVPADLANKIEDNIRELTGLNRMCNFLQESTASIRQGREEDENRAIEQHRSFIELYAHICDSFGEARS